MTIFRKPEAGEDFFVLLDKAQVWKHDVISWFFSFLSSHAVFSLNRCSPCFISLFYFLFFLSWALFPVILTPSVSNFLSHSLEEHRLNRRRCSLVNEFFLPVSQVRAQALSCASVCVTSSRQEQRKMDCPPYVRE